MPWDEQSRKPRRNGWPSRGRNVSRGHSLARPADAAVRWCIRIGPWRPLTGRLNFTNRSAIARLVAEIFFPQRPALGLNQRTYSAAVVDKIVSANAEEKSTYKAQKMLKKLAELSISVPEILDLSSMIGQELRTHQEEQATAHAAGTLEPQYSQTPSLAVVSPDGGRIMTRAEGDRGVHDQAWKESKNACLMTMSSTPAEHDPHPELPTCFKDRVYVEQLVREIHSTACRGPQNSGEIPAIPGETAVASSSACKSPARQLPTNDSRKEWRPQRLVRTCVSSMVSSDEFGPLVAGEAQRRGFYQAPRRAFLGDGQAWNWTLQAIHFPTFVPVADFVHPLGYVYDAAKVLTPEDPWPLHLGLPQRAGKGACRTSSTNSVHGKPRIPSRPIRSCRTKIRGLSSKRQSLIWKTIAPA